MAESPKGPALTPRFCFNQTALRDFLRTSRGAVDDTITQNLNALVTPSREPFTPPDNTSRSDQRRSAPRRSPIPSTTCESFTSRVLFPSWQARSDVLEYCAGVATSPDPDDPEQLQRASEDAAAWKRLVDERLDPYSGRYFPREARTQALAGLVRNERMVESIVRARTWAMVGERCEDAGDVVALDAEAAFEQWRQKQRKGR